MFDLSAFGKNDIRGVYGKNVTEDLFLVTGEAYVRYAQKVLGKKKINLSVIRDVRLHSKPLALSLIKGILKAGGNVVNLGEGPTPFGYFSEYTETPFGEPDGALIITASHNPSEYNGLKMTLNRHSLNESDIKEVKSFVEDILAGNVKFNEEAEGHAIDFDIKDDYIEYMSRQFKAGFKGVKIVTDCANATAGIIAPELYKKLGAEVIELYTEPDGRFPNHHPNPSIEQTLDTLKKVVVENSADVGIAFDGDSDRIGIIDSDGNYLTGDKLLWIYATQVIPESFKHNILPAIVSEVKCSQVLFDAIRQIGAIAIMCKTGHGYIKGKMKETDAILAGEMSGHMFFKDRYFGFDDAIYAGCRIIEIIKNNRAVNSEFRITNLLKPFKAVVSSPEVRFLCPDELKKPVLNLMASKIENNKKIFGDDIIDIITLDGLRVVFDGGFALIRQSNTEPVFTLRFEGKSEDLCNLYKNRMLEELEICIKEVKNEQ